MRKVVILYSEYPMRFLLRSSLSCCDRHDPAAIIENIMFKKTMAIDCIETLCFNAINRHGFFNALCDRGSQYDCLIIPDRHVFLVGPDNVQWTIRDY